MVSAITILLVALAYGISPQTSLPLLFDFHVDTIDLKQVFRAIMGLYLAHAALWALGALNPVYWKLATVSSVVFMGGLAVGRLTALLLDGWPSPYFLAGLLVELGLAVWGLVNLRRY